MPDSSDNERSEGNSEGGNFSKALQIISVAVTCTYISGYLVASTFLNSYGISADVSEFIRAKYLYVGSLFLLALATEAILLGCIVILYGGIRKALMRRPIYLKCQTALMLQAREQSAMVDILDTGGAIQEGAANVARRLAKRKTLECARRYENRRRIYTMIWAVIGVCVSLSESVQISELRPDNYHKYVILQTCMLSAFLFYQITNARTLHHDGWERSQSIANLRLWSMASIVFFSIFMPLLFHANHKLPDVTIPNLGNNRWVALPALLLVLVSAWVIMIPFFYTGESLRNRLLIEDKSHDPYDLEGFRWGFLLIPIAFLGLNLFIWAQGTRHASLHNGYYVNLALPVIWYALRKVLFSKEIRERRAKFRELYPRYIQGIGKRRSIIAAGILSLSVLLVFVSHHKRWIFLEFFNVFLAAACFLSVIALALAYSRRRQKDRRLNPIVGTQQWMIFLLRGIVAVVFYVTATFGYGYVFYPRIPVAKYGGDYRTATIVRIYLRYERDGGASQKSLSNAPDINSQKPSITALLKQLDPSQRLYPDQTASPFCNPLTSVSCDGLVILEETEDIIYFARVDDASSLYDGQKPKSRCGPYRWVSGAVEDNDGPYRPRVLAINRRDVLAIEDIEDVSKSSDCKDEGRFKNR